MARHFGEIPGVVVGATFADRAELAAAGVHKPLQAGISGGGLEGADSIVLSGGYEDDEDRGDEIVYTGHGGNDPQTGRQVRDQELKTGNLALARSHLEGLPVRVVRGAGLDSPFAPGSGYRYDGLYGVDDYWSDAGKSGYLVWRFRLRRLEAQAKLTSPTHVPPEPPKKIKTTIVRVVRSTIKAINVKKRHAYQCQICGVKIETPAGPYAEGAHIQGLGTPHNGPDVEENILCLCPNHHVMLDSGAFAITDDFQLLGLEGRLHLVKGHHPAAIYLGYHRGHHGFAK
jgi:putative restriction endonuclease